MTCIIAFRDKQNKIVLAGDRMGSDGHSKIHVKQPKVFRNGKFMIGYTDSFRMGQLLEYSWSPPDRNIEQTDYQYIYGSVINSILTCLDGGRFWSSDRKDSFGTFILCYGGHIFLVGSDLSLIENQYDVIAIGSGAEIARGAVAAFIQYETDPEEIARKSFAVIHQNNVYVTREHDLIRE